MKDKAWLIQKVSDIFWRVEIDGDFNIQNANIMFDDISNLIDELDEPETLSQEWIDENKVARINNLRKMTTSDVVPVEKLKNLIVPKQEEVDRAYKDGYEKGKEYTFYKGYLEGITDKGSEPETVANVLADFYKSLERLKKVLSMEVEELEE